MNPLRLLVLTFLISALLSANLSAQRKREQQRFPEPDLPKFETRYYIIHTDIEREDAQEAAIRMTKMAEEYYQRTREFSGAIRQKLPFYLFKHEDDYYAAGGWPGSAGVFTGDRLMAIAGAQAGAETWHVVQHEGFHQFANAVIGGDLPIWVNEGLAEYFGESLFTGDGFVTGVIPQWRLERIRLTLQEDRFKSLEEMMLLPHAQWNLGLSIENYDQAWSMVQFLAHGQDGKYQKAFITFMKGINSGRPWRKAWIDSFGDAKGFEAQWREYWSSLPDHPTATLYAQATTATLTSYLARATSQKQRFAQFEEFLQAAKKGELKFAKEDWLPPKLLNEAIENAKGPDQWSIESPAGKLPQIVATTDDSTRIVGSFLLSGGRVKSVIAEIDDSPQSLAKARSLIDEGNKKDAKALLQDVIKTRPNSPAAEQARKMMLETK